MNLGRHLEELICWDKIKGRIGFAPNASNMRLMRLNMGPTAYKK